MKLIYALAPALMLAACARSERPAACPDLASVVPASVAGADIFKTLPVRLAGADRENAISETVARIHARDPSLGQDVITDILIAADCPNLTTVSEQDLASQKQRIETLRTEIDQIFAAIPQAKK